MIRRQTICCVMCKYFVFILKLRSSRLGSAPLGFVFEKNTTFNTDPPHFLCTDPRGQTYSKLIIVGRSSSWMSVCRGVRVVDLGRRKISLSKKISISLPNVHLLWSFNLE